MDQYFSCTLYKTIQPEIILKVSVFSRCKNVIMDKYCLTSKLDMCLLQVILYLYMGLKECLAELEKVFKGTAIDEDNVGKFVCGVELSLIHI